MNGLLLSSSCRCRRLAKEKISYQTEAQQQEEKVKRLKEEAGDPYVIKKQVSFFLKKPMRLVPKTHQF